MNMREGERVCVLILVILLIVLDSYNSRPRDSFFYSGLPSYFKLKAKIYAALANVEKVERKHLLILKEKSSIEKILNEVLNDKKVSLFD